MNELIKMQKTEQLSSITTQIGSAITVWSALWGWLGDNHHSIASCGVIVGIIISVVSFRRQVLNERKIKKTIG